MKSILLIQLRKNMFAHKALSVFMALSLLLQNASSVQYAYAYEDEHTQSTESVSVASTETVVVTTTSSHESTESDDAHASTHKEVSPSSHDDDNVKDTDKHDDATEHSQIETLKLIAYDLDAHEAYKGHDNHESSDCDEDERDHHNDGDSHKSSHYMHYEDESDDCDTHTIVNTPPVITVVGTNPLTIFQNSVFTDLGATAFDLEDGTVTPTATGTVNTAVLGTYTITYTAKDSQNLAATPKTRTVIVVPVGTPVNQKPEITLLGDVAMTLVIGTTFINPGATAFDLEDGTITPKIIVTGTVNTSLLGIYTITYNATDSKNLAADPKTRTVTVVPAPPTGCTTNCGGGSTIFDYFGCMNPNASNYNRLANKDDGSCQFPGGGGGGGSIPLSISNEKLVVSGTTSVTITWNTNLPADSRVVYGDVAVVTLGVAPKYSYPLTNATDTAFVYNHSMVINGIPSAITTYFRPVSSKTSETVVGIELKRVPDITSGQPLACEYLKEYLRIGVNNNPSEVTKLQLFLKNYEGFSNLDVTGFFDITTDKAVRMFQDKYKKDVLDSWNLPSNTGYVYYTTKKKINEIYCQREFPLTDTQKLEIDLFRQLINRINITSSTSGSVVTLPLVGLNKTKTGVSGSVAGASTVKTPITISIAPTKGSNDSFATRDLEAAKVKVATLDNNGAQQRGRIAIADLLATAPSIASGIARNGSTSDIESVDASTSLDESLTVDGVSKRGFLAAVVNSVSSRIEQCAPSTPYFMLIFFFLMLIFATLYFRKAAEIESIKK